MSNSNAAAQAAASSTTYDIYGNILGGFCRGPLHTLTKIEVANEVVWSGTLLRSASTNPVLLSVPGRGWVEVYFGDESQVISSWFATIAARVGHVHPNYRGLCFVALNRFLFGREMYSAPNIRLAGLREPVQSVITGPACDLVDGQANPWVALAEIFTDPLGGLGHPLDLFDAPSWQAMADACIPRAPEVYVSLRLGDRTNARTLAANLLAMCGGWVRPKRGTGRLEAGMWTAPSSINVGALPVINSRIADDEVEIEPETWDDVKYRTSVTFKNRENLYKDDVAKYEDPRARRHSTNRSSLQLDLPIVRPAQAATQARLNGRLRAMPGAKYSVSYRGPALPLLQPGEHCLLDIDPIPGGAQLLQVCRIISIDRPFSSRTHTVSLEAERTLAPLAYTPADEPGTPGADEVPAIANHRLLELSPESADGEDAAVALLAQRPGPMVTDLLIYYDSIASLGATYPLLSRARTYALRASLHASIDADDTTLVVDLAGTLDRELADAPPGAVAARNDTLLLFIIGPLDESGGGYNRPYEILSILDLSASGTDQLTLTAFRARLGTTALAASAASEVWIVPRAGLPWFRHADFETRITTGQLCYFKLQPATANRARPLDEITPVSFRFNTTRAFAPVITTVSPTVDSGEDFTSLDLEEKVVITGSVTDVDENLESLSIVVLSEGVETNLYSRTYVGIASTTYATEYTPPSAGIYQIVIRAVDSTGRTVEKTQNLHVALSSAPRCAEPTFEEISEEVQWYETLVELNVRWYVNYKARIHCASMAIDGGASSTIRIQTASVPIGTTLEAVVWNDEPINTNPEPDAGTESGQVYSSPYHYADSRRVWARAIDTATVSPLANSYAVYRDYPRG